jgi:hypothetical protein
MMQPYNIDSEVRDSASDHMRVRVRRVQTIDAPLRMPTVAECVRFERESFGALHQMLSGLDDAGRQAAWDEIAERLAKFEGPGGFVGPCELLIVSGTRR